MYHGRSRLANCDAPRYVYTKLYEETPDRRGVLRSTISSKLRSFDHSPLVSVLHSSITGRKDIVYGEIDFMYSPAEIFGNQRGTFQDSIAFTLCCIRSHRGSRTADKADLNCEHLDLDFCQKNKLQLDPSRSLKFCVISWNVCLQDPNNNLNTFTDE